MVGKSSVAVSLAGKLLYHCISTDDIGEALQTVVNINPMRGQNYLDYYAYNKKTDLVEDIIGYHKALEPAIFKLIDIHSTWGNPIIIEGWAIYPSKIKELSENVFSVWLIADSNLLKTRIISNKEFYINAKESQRVIDHYLYRSEWHNKLILEQCKVEKKNYILVTEETTTDEIVSSIMEILKTYE